MPSHLRAVVGAGRRQRARCLHELADRKAGLTMRARRRRASRPGAFGAAPASIAVAAVVAFALAGGHGAFAAQVIRVPSAYPTIQAAINAAQNGDTVLVSPGTYAENLVISGKSITLASEFLTTGDRGLVDGTVIAAPAGPNAITVQVSSLPKVTIVGFKLTNVGGAGVDGIRAFAPTDILDNHIVGFDDAIDLESAQFVVRNNLVENSGDDGVDLDGPSTAVIENNVLTNGRDDGIEARLSDFAARLDIVIRGNTISRNNHDGIQLIDEAGASDRFVTIERNLILDQHAAGLGLMDNGATTEDFRAASLLDEIHLFDNTFRGNNHAVSGGDNLVAVNNLFVGSTVGIKGVDGNSIAAHNLFWSNGTNIVSSNVDAATTLVADPLLASDATLLSGSPAIDAGTPSFTWQGRTVLDLPLGSYSGGAPDLGVYERSVSASGPETTITAAPSSPTNSTAASFSFVSSIAGSTFVCSLDGAPSASCISPVAYVGLGDGSHAFAVTATDPAGTTDPTPASRGWTVDTRPPETTIVSGPPDPSSSASASFGFTSSETGSTLACSLDGASYAACSSPKTYSALANGAHTFAVRATDAAGNVDPTPASHAWTVQSAAQTLALPPEADAQVQQASPGANFGTATSLGADLSPNTESYVRFTVTGLQGAVTSAKLRLFAFNGTTNGPALYATGTSWTETGITWNNKPARTGGPIEDKASIPVGTWVEYDVTTAITGNGTYSFDIAPGSSDGVDFNSREAATNRPELVVTSSATGGDTTPPETTIDLGPSGPVNSTTAQFGFSATEAGSSFECSLDGAAFAACSSPASLTGLGEGSHTFQVRARDATGNVDQSPAARSWTVDTTLPAVAQVAPAGGAVDVAPGSPVTATFSESMAGTSLTTSTFTLVRTGESTPLPAVVSYDAATRRATLDPSADLDTGTSYTATVTTAARDLAGNALGAPSVWSFTTAAAPPPPPPPGAITRESVSTTAGSGASTVAVVAKPPGTVAGDVLVACLALNGGAVASSGVPAGWVPIAPAPSGNPRVYGYYKVAGGSEPTDYRWTLTSSVQSGAGIGRYSGVSTTAPLDVGATTASGPAATSATIPGVTTVSANAMVIGCVGINSSSVGTTITSPAGMIQAWDIGGKRHELADTPQAGAGPSGSKTWSFSSSRAWAGWLTALRAR